MRSSRSRIATAVDRCRALAGTVAIPLCASLVLAACAARPPAAGPRSAQELAVGYTAAWCSQQPERVASYYAPNGSLQINAGAIAHGRQAIAAAAHGFMAAFPDLVVRMDGLDVHGNQALYRWTLTGHNTGPGGTGRAVTISGYEEWTIGADGLVAASLGHFDSADYDRQINGGSAAPR